jgi:hypothetical protein
LKTNGSALPDASEDRAQPVEPPKSAAAKKSPAKGSSRRPDRRRRTEAPDQIVRYFVGRPAADDGKPTLEQEVASEPEGLVIAFKNDSRVYFVHEYRVTQRIEGNEVRLEKQPVNSAKRVSTANAS